MENSGAVPVYLSFPTFLNAIASLRKNGISDKIDRAIFSSRSVVDQSQIISAFRFLGLVDNSNNTQQSLRDLINSKENSQKEKYVLKKILEDSYSNIFQYDLKTVTSAQIETIIGEYGTRGATKARAVRFFIKASEYCGIEISSLLTEGTRRKHRLVMDRNKHMGLGVSGQDMKIIDLPGAKGKLSITGTFNLFDLVGDERKLVFGIIDLMEEYEKKTK